MRLCGLTPTRQNHQDGQEPVPADWGGASFRIITADDHRGRSGSSSSCIVIGSSMRLGASSFVTHHAFGPSLIIAGRGSGPGVVVNRVRATDGLDRFGHHRHGGPEGTGSAIHHPGSWRATWRIGLRPRRPIRHPSPESTAGVSGSTNTPLTNWNVPLSVARLQP